MALTLSPRSQRAFERLSADVQRVFGPRFIGLLAYGERASLLFVGGVQADDLDALAPLSEAWHREGLATPQLMTSDEFRRSLDAFPLEYQAILLHHVVVAGTNPLQGAVVPAEDVRRACEIHAKGHLLHLRQGWIEAGGHASHLAQVAEQSAAPFRALLTAVAHLSGARAEHADDLAAFAEQAAGLDRALTKDLLSLERSPDARRRVAGRMREYLTGVERLWAFVDAWQPRRA